jgi:hypothetical protein
MTMAQYNRIMYANKAVVSRLKNKRVAVFKMDGGIHVEMTRVLPKSEAGSPGADDCFKRNGIMRTTSIGISDETLNEIIYNYVCLIADERGHDFRKVSNIQISYTLNQ